MKNFLDEWLESHSRVNLTKFSSPSRVRVFNKMWLESTRVRVLTRTRPSLDKYIVSMSLWPTSQVYLHLPLYTCTGKNWASDILNQFLILKHIEKSKNIPRVALPSEKVTQTPEQ
jgi:hypothetical protein